MPQSQSALIDPVTLKDLQSKDNVVVLFTEMVNPVNPGVTNPFNCYIPNSILFDFEGEFCDKSANQPHTLPSAEEFAAKVVELGIDNQSTIVVYDAQNMFCSPRVWWMFKVMGHENVFVLNGGLSSWIKSDFETTPSLSKPSQNQKTQGAFLANFQTHLFVNKQDLLAQINRHEVGVIDARSLERFLGKAPEPRKGVRSGHIPNAKCLPYGNLIDGNAFIDSKKLAACFKKLDFDVKNKLIFSCGSGVTACVLALAAYEIGVKNWAVYDGSWTEWGSDLELPVSLSSD